MSNQKSMATRQNWWTMVAMIALVTLAWSGVLDGYSADYLDRALLGSGAIYATARGINALVSVLQGTEMNAFFITFTIGELLDPLNDLIERFSGVMMLAIGSLAMQKILLQIVSDSTFNVLLTILGAGAVATGLWGTRKQYTIVSRFFFVTVVIRFSLALVVIANSWADTIFLEKNERNRHLAMQGFHGELGLIGSRAGINIDLSGDIQDVEAALRQNQQAQDVERKTLHLNRTRLEQAEAELEVLDDISIWGKLTGDTTVDIEGKRAEIKKLEDTIEANEYTLTALAESRAARQDRLDCLKKRSRGESCSIADSMSNALAAFDVKQRIDALGNQISEFASNLINLLMSLILKSILLPILFLYALLRSMRLIFATIW